MNARDELAKLLFITDNGRARDVEALWAEAKEEHLAYVYNMADAMIAAGYRKAEPFWDPTLDNDGVYEYTTSGACDGKTVYRWRREPRLRYESDYHPWEEYVPEVTA